MGCVSVNQRSATNADVRPEPPRCVFCTTYQSPCPTGLERKPLLSNANFYRFGFRNTALPDPASEVSSPLPMLGCVALALGDLPLAQGALNRAAKPARAKRPHPSGDRT